MHNDDFYDFVEKLSSADKLPEATEMLRAFMRDAGLTNMSYAALNLPGGAHERPLLAMTYSPDWQRHYAQERYVDIDPVVRAGLAGILPVDWAEIDRSSRLVRKFFGEAQDLRVGRQGLSIPIRGRHGEFALFSLTADVSDAEWSLQKKKLVAEAMMLAYNFHSVALRSVHLEQEKGVSLSHRETSCLRWKALGKSDKDIAAILDITVHTVRFHMETARSKLGAANATHAVAKAISGGLINLSVEPPASR